MSILKVDSLKVSFGNNEVLKDVSFEIEAGKVTVYAGLNASGKTTTIKSILGILVPDKGEINLFGETSARKHIKMKKRIGYVPETHEYYPTIRVGDALKYISSFYPTWDPEYEKLLLGEFNLDKKVRFKALSRGQKAKLFLTFALAHKPELIIMDEPTSHLDPVARTDFWERTLELLEETDSSIFISTHILNDIENIADDYIILKEGHIRLHKTAEELKTTIKAALVSKEEFKAIKKDDYILSHKRIGDSVMVFSEAFKEMEKYDWQDLSGSEAVEAYLRER